MASEFHKNLQYVTGHRENRQKNANEVLANPVLFKELIEICFLISDKDAHKACWILEFVSYQKLEWLQPHLDFFCENIEKLKEESAIRPIAKVSQLLVASHFKKTENAILLSEIHLQKIAETCFDWLIKDAKVASKVYAARTLYLLGEKFEWIYPELQRILIEDYIKHSAAYKAVAKEVLKKIK